MNFDPKDYMQQPRQPHFNTYNNNDFIQTGKNTMVAMLKQLEETNERNTELQEQVKKLGKPHTLRDILLILFGAAAGLGFTILAVVLGWLK